MAKRIRRRSEGDRSSKQAITSLVIFTLTLGGWALWRFYPRRAAGEVPALVAPEGSASPLSTGPIDPDLLAETVAQVSSEAERCAAQTKMQSAGALHFAIEIRGGVVRAKDGRFEGADGPLAACVAAALASLRIEAPAGQKDARLSVRLPIASRP